MTPYSLLEAYRRFESTYCLLVQGCLLYSSTLKIEAYVIALVEFYQTTQRHIAGEMLFIVTAVGTTNHKLIFAIFYF
jgi:hypothetical protein